MAFKVDKKMRLIYKKIKRGEQLTPEEVTYERLNGDIGGEVIGHRELTEEEKAEGERFLNRILKREEEYKNGKR